MTFSYLVDGLGPRKRSLTYDGIYVVFVVFVLVFVYNLMLPFYVSMKFHKTLFLAFNKYCNSKLEISFILYYTCFRNSSTPMMFRCYMLHSFIMNSC